MLWQPIEDLPLDWQNLASSELPPLVTVWNEQADRADYITALEEADQGDLSSLINLFAKSQKQAFLRSLGLSEQVLSEARRTQVIISSIAEKLKQNQSASIQEQCRKAEKFASKLFAIASNRLQDIADEIKRSVQDFVDDAQVFTISSPAGDPRSYYIDTKSWKQLNSWDTLPIFGTITLGFN